jgi:hypothetical protein
VMAKNASNSEPADRANEPRESEPTFLGNQVAFAEAFRFWVKLGFIGGDQFSALRRANK